MSNAGIGNVTAAITVAQALVPKVDAIAASAKASGAPMTGADKLALFQQAVQIGHDTLAPMATGGAKASVDEYWPLLNAAVTAICATNKVINDPVFGSGQGG